MGIAKDKLTEEQKREVERLRQFVSRNRLNVLMNSTKWRAAIDAVAGIAGYPAPFRVRQITDLQDPPLSWSPGFPAGLPLYNAIEWIELDVRPDRRGPDFTDPLQRALKAAGVPIAIEETGLRILGHARPGRP
ncbi:MAG: hypothetical protein JF616_19270 [Fibrobacteres bacterium]|jgi:hypothetical protein|nr:hypothetical protein [Fibrobacterota bacterium]